MPDTPQTTFQFVAVYSEAYPLINDLMTRWNASLQKAIQKILASYVIGSGFGEVRPLTESNGRRVAVHWLKVPTLLLEHTDHVAKRIGVNRDALLGAILEAEAARLLDRESVPAEVSA